MPLISYNDYKVKFKNQTGLEADKNVDTYIQWLRFFLQNNYSFDLSFLDGASEGDMVVYDGSQWIKLSVGAEGYVIASESDLPTYKAISDIITAGTNLEWDGTTLNASGGGGGGGFQTLTDGATVSWDVDDGYTAVWVLGANRDMPTLSNHSAGDVIYLYVIQDSGGSGYVVDFAGCYSSGAVDPSFSSGADDIDLFTFNIIDISGTLYPVLTNVNNDVQLLS